LSAIGDDTTYGWNVRNPFAEIDVPDRRAGFRAQVDDIDLGRDFSRGTLPKV
jgi:hypothetical protein